MLESYAKPRFTVAPDFSAARGRRLLIALSGGADSVALAVLLAEVREEYRLTLLAAHVDHGIRPDSPEDAEFCRTLCRQLDIPFYCARLDVPAEARRRREGLESAARWLRYEQLRRFRDALGADLIALAHHMDDQAETVLMHLCRGAGTGGMAGMRPLTGDLWRPLLGCRKAELVDYLRGKGLAWREDATNAVADNPRNAIRLHALPELEKCYPQCVPAIARYASTAGIEDDCLGELTGEFLARGGGVGGHCRWIELERAPHRAILRRALLAACPEPLSWEQVNALEALCGQGRGKVDISSGVFAERTGHRLYFVQKQPPRIESAALNLDGVTALPGLGRVTARPCAPVPIRDDPMRQVLDPAALSGAVLRTRRPGDRIRPLGSGDRLLSDYFIDRKVDRPLRDATPLIAVGDRVHWVIGHGISGEAALAPGCEAIELKFEREN
ncbi:MAG: tRNA lysidine(34) synthetase TilS [Clostridia bacterium]|nr:tRNA lysidine(34) synthetase TilS [Clostridia bacterium]